MKTPLVTLAFDDGWMSQYKEGLPILDSFGMKATFYIITQYMHATYPERIGVSEVLNLHSKSHEIGAHTVTHPNLNWPQIKNWKEIKKSKQDIERIGIPATSFAYPYGRYNSFVRWLTKQAGYENARAVRCQLNTTKTSRWDICCMPVVRKTTIKKIEEWVAEAERENKWLVLLFHQLDNNPKAIYGCSPKVFKETCELLSRSNAAIVPLSEACKLYL